MDGSRQLRFGRRKSRTMIGERDGAIVDAVVAGTTSGLTAVDRARAGAMSAVRVAIVGPGGTSIEHVVRNLGYTATLCAVDPDTIGEALARSQAHVVLLDVTAPAAAAVLTQLLVERQHLPVVAIDGAVGTRASDAWLAAGADDHVTTDQATPTILRRVVESAIARGRARDLRQRLDEVDRLSSIATLAGGVAHEVNNPAAYVLMNLRTCQETVSDLRRELVDDAPGDGTPNRYAARIDEMIEMLDDNVRGVERIVAVVQSLRSFARPEPDRVEQVDLPSVCREVYELLGSQLRHRARVALELDPVPPVAADPRQLQQVVINLFVNAAESIPPGESGHEIRVRVRARGRRVELSVIDTGQPLSPTQQARVFDPFFPGRAIQTSNGLGLATVRAVVARMGGSVEVGTRPGGTTEFIVVLPLQGEAAVAAAESVAVRGERLRVLVIDDEVAITRAMRRHLRNFHEVTVTNDVTNALAIIAHEDFDVILSDVMMPGKDGPALLETLRRTRPELVPRLVLMSAGLTDPIREVVRAQGGRLIDKPIPFERLVALIESVHRDAGPLPPRRR